MNKMILIYIVVTIVNTLLIIIVCKYNKKFSRNSEFHPFLLFAFTPIINILMFILLFFMAFKTKGGKKLLRIFKSKE